MATEEQVASVRRMADEPGTDTYTDSALSALVDSTGSAEAAAARVWQEKAGRFASLVNTSESGSSRSMSQLHTNALNMAAYWTKQATTGGEVVVEADYPMTVDIERA